MKRDGCGRSAITRSSIRIPKGHLTRSRGSPPTSAAAPVATISLIDQERQWYKSRVGVELTETPRDHSFCAHTILQHELVIVPDATLDPRFADNPFVLGEPRVRFYAGLPLITEEGFAIGSLCVVDIQPRNLTSGQCDALVSLGRHIVTTLGTAPSPHGPKPG